jgi:hypothetical protein
MADTAEIVGRLVEGLRPEAIVLISDDADGLYLLVIAETCLGHMERNVKARTLLHGIDGEYAVIVETPDEIFCEISRPYSFIHDCMLKGEFVYGNFVRPFYD